MAGFDPEALLSEHRLYDQYVDVVSAFEWLFTETATLPDTVAHFERYPKVVGADGNAATPDFSIVFKDGSGVAGEIARIALADASVDGLCRQILRYDQLTELPGPDGPVPVSHVDVLLLVPVDIGTAVVHRVLRQRLLDAEHFYKPGNAPVVVQYVPQPDRYVFQRRSEVENGRFREGIRAPDALGHWFDRDDLKTPPGGFVHVKAARPFINDPVAPLYLACQLWTKVLPVIAADLAAIGDYKPIVATLARLREKTSELLGAVEGSAVRGAMEILVATRSAESLAPDRWRIAWGDLSHRSGEDLSEVLARRTVNPPAKGPIRRLLDGYADLGVPDPEHLPPPEPGQLFNL